MKWPFQRDDSADDGYTAARRDMVDQQLRARGIADENVLRAMGRVPRHAFVPERLHGLAYTDGPLPIGQGQTISQPYVVAAMSEALAARPGMRVLEIGTGSGYQAAVLAEMGLEVYTVEFIPSLLEEARQRLAALGYRSMRYRCGDGHAGWPEEAPFDGIIVTAAPASLPPELPLQLAAGGRLVIPVGTVFQDLHVYRKDQDGTLARGVLFAVRFVPLVRD